MARTVSPDTMDDNPDFVPHEEAHVDPVTLDPRVALRAAIDHVVTCARACAASLEQEEAMVEAGMLLSDGHYEVGWSRLGAVMRDVLT